MASPIRGGICRSASGMPGRRTETGRKCWSRRRFGNELSRDQMEPRNGRVNRAAMASPNSLR